MSMTLQELTAETLVQKNRRIRQGKCPHEAVHSSTYLGPKVSFTNDVCLDCGKLWRTEHTANKGTEQ